MMSEPMTTMSIPASLVTDVELLICRKTEPLCVEEVEDVCGILCLKMSEVIRASDGWNKLVTDMTNIKASSHEEHLKLQEAALSPLSHASGYLPRMIETMLWEIHADIKYLHEMAERTLKAS